MQRRRTIKSRFLFRTEGDYPRRGMARMNGNGIHTETDLRTRSLEFLQLHFGKSGGCYYWIPRCIDDRLVRANRIRKSVGADTFSFAELEKLNMRYLFSTIIEGVARAANRITRKWARASGIELGRGLISGRTNEVKKYNERYNKGLVHLA